MKPAFLPDRPRYPQCWSELPLGQQIKQQTELALQQQCRQLFGYHLVQLGDLTCQLDLSFCSIHHKVKQASVNAEYCALQSKADELPYQNNSVDVFVLAHELDFSKDPHQILREVNRAIIPDGYVVISGFNPFSLAGIARFLPWRRNHLLSDARFFRAERIKDWLQLLGFDVVSDRRFIHRSLLFSRKTDVQSKWQTLAHKWLPMCGAIYVIVARKKESTLTLIKPKWKRKSGFSTVTASVPVSHRLHDARIGKKSTR